MTSRARSPASAALRPRTGLRVSGRPVATSVIIALKRRRPSGPSMVSRNVRPWTVISSGTGGPSHLIPARLHLLSRTALHAGQQRCQGITTPARVLQLHPGQVRRVSGDVADGQAPSFDGRHARLASRRRAVGLLSTNRGTAPAHEACRMEFMDVPVVAVTIGDPAGIGPEIG